MRCVQLNKTTIMLPIIHTVTHNWQTRHSASLLCFHFQVTGCLYIDKHFQYHTFNFEFNIQIVLGLIPSTALI